MWQKASYQAFFRKTEKTTSQVCPKTFESTSWCQSALAVDFLPRQSRL
jgi:hypothetical protein